MNLSDLYKNDIAGIYKEIGSLVEYKGIQVYGILQHDPTEIMSLNDKQYTVQATELTLTIPTGSLGAIKNNTDIKVSNVLYKITKYVLFDNGLQMKIWLVGV